MITSENTNMQLYSPVSYANITLPTRIIRSATELFSSEPDGSVSEFEIEHYRTLATQPYGMVITGHSCVMAEGRTNLGQNAVWDDCFMDGQKKLCDIIHSSPFGTKIVLQLGHGGAKAKGFDGHRIMSPDNMTAEDFESVTAHFVSAAVRAKSAGFDGVQIHGAHGYLLSEMFYPEYNHRIDEYGGSAENRFRLIMEIAATIKAVCGEDFPVFLKLNATDRPLTDVMPCSEQYHNDLMTAVRLCGEVGIEALELSGYHSSPKGNDFKRPYFIRELMRLCGGSPVPVILVGGIRSAECASEAFDFGASAVSLCRPVLCEPDFPSRIGFGAVSKCVSCNSCFGDLSAGRVIRCHREDGISQ